MNTNPNIVKVLCFGDSNTWGYIPISEQRYPANVRWTGLLQKKLGNDFWVIEEGLNGRTTNMDDPEKPGKNGLAYLRPCLETHNPIDLVILMLGTNDLKNKFERTPESIAKGIELLVEEIRLTAKNNQTHVSELLLISPILVDDSVEKAKEKFLDAGRKSKHLAEHYRIIAEKNQIPFIDAAKHVSPSTQDGIHLEPVSHQILADKIYQRVKAIFRTSS